MRVDSKKWLCELVVENHANYLAFINNKPMVYSSKQLEMHIASLLPHVEKIAKKYLENGLVESLTANFNELTICSKDYFIKICKEVLEV